MSSGLAVVAVLFTACSPDSDSVLGTSDALSNNTVETGYINVYKFGPAGTYSFTASETGSGLYGPNFTVVAGGSRTIWSQGNPAAGNSDVTVTETVPADMQVDSIVVVKFTSAVFTSQTKYTGTNTVTLAGANNTTDWAVKVYNSVLPPPPPGGQGCTPGYWRQTQHFASWTGYAPTDMFAAVFGVTYAGTLLDAVSNGSGGVHALARHSVAALLNAASSGVDYPATPAQVIAAVQAAFASGNFEAQKDIFEGWNEAGCLLD